MTRLARELQRTTDSVPHHPDGPAAAVRRCASGGVALWEAARDLVQLCRYPRPLLRRPGPDPEELTELLLTLEQDLEARARLVRRWRSA